MLKLIWSPDLTTVDPGSDAYKLATDTLQVGGAVQSFARPWPRAFQAPNAALAKAVIDWVATQGNKPITLMVHGFAFDPTHPQTNPADDPFNLVYGIPGANLNARLSWLPIVGEADDNGNPGTGAAIAFSWLSESNVTQWADAGWNNSYLQPAFDFAPLAAQALAAVIAALQGCGKPFTILAHSLGTRTTCQAIGYLRFSTYAWQPQSLKRIVLLDGAEYLVDANRNLLGTGLGYEVFNIVNRNDLVLSWLAHAGSYPVRPRVGAGDSGRVIGYEGLKKTSTWIDIQIDRQDVQNWVQTHAGIQLNATAPNADNQIHDFATWNHWICYMDGVGNADGGNRGFLRRLLDLNQPGVAWFDANGYPVLDGARYVDEWYYGSFDPAIPDAPMTVAERQALEAPFPLGVIGIG